MVHDAAESAAISGKYFLWLPESSRRLGREYSD